MAKTQTSKGLPKRAGKHRTRRSAYVGRSRRNHLKNATRSNGKAFAEKLREYYFQVGDPPKKVR